MLTSGRKIQAPRRVSAWGWTVALLVAASGCSESAKGTRSGASISVAAASDLQAPLAEIAREFQKENAGRAVSTTIGASGQLVRQIQAGAPFDLFLSANEQFVKGLAVENLVKPASVRPYAVGSLVMAVRADATEPIESLADLLKPGVKKVAIANPETAPYGAAARQALKAAGLWEKLGETLVPADSVLQAFQFVQSGNADVAFVGRALTKRKQGVRVVAVDPALYDPIVQSLGIVSASKLGAEAEAFARFVTGPKGQAILRSYGFDAPPDRDAGRP